MTNNYAMNPYSQDAFQQNMYYQEMSQRKSSSPSIGGMMLLGGVGGGAYGYLKNRYAVSKSGNISDTFVKKVFDKQLKQNGSEADKSYFKQLDNVMKKIDKVKSPEEFKKLIRVNKDVISNHDVVSADTLLEAVNTTNLKNTKQTMKESLRAIKDMEMLKTKNAIRFAWDADAKKFVKTDAFKDSKLFEVIKSTQTNTQLKKALKYGGITAGILGALTIAYKLVVPPTIR